MHENLLHLRTGNDFAIDTENWQKKTEYTNMKADGFKHNRSK